MKQSIILGPPGTGKTTSLLNIVDQKLRDGIHPDEIAFVSFTRKAAHEARERAILKFPALRGQKMPYFNTLHSIGYHRLQLSRTDVMQGTDWRTIAREVGMPFSGYYDKDDGSIPSGGREGDRYYFQYCLATAKKMDPLEHYRTLPADVRYEMKETRLREFVNYLKLYKKENGLTDFSDMIDMATPIGPAKGVKVAIVDEAQDLSRQQWDFVNSMFSEVDELYIAGDDDQAIYRWSGADLDTFMNLKGERKVLERSWRLPRQIWQYANQFTSRIKHRYPKEWGPDDREGSVKFVEKPQYAPVGEGGEWLILVRNVYQMAEIEELCKNGGIPYMSKGRPAVTEGHMRAIHDWEKLRKGDEVSRYEAQNVYDHMRGNVDIKRGFKDLTRANEEVNMQNLTRHHGLMVDPKCFWYDALSRIPLAHRAYYRRIRSRGEKITGKPRVNISTIHGVKGGEADNVLLMNTLAYRTRKEFDRNPDDEHRVFYVGATRAKENLFLCRTKENNTYPLPVR